MSKKTKKKSKTVIKTIGERLNLAIRSYNLFLLRSKLIHINSEYNSELMEEAIQMVKYIFYDTKNEWCDSILDKRYFMELINYTEEIILATRKNNFSVISNNGIFREVLLNSKNRLVALLKENNIQNEFILFTNKVALLLENPDLYLELNATENKLDAVARFTDLVYLLGQYITTFSCPYKNFIIDYFYLSDEDNHVYPKYSGKLLYTEKEINSLSNILKKNSFVNDDFHNVQQIMEKFLNQFHNAYANFMGKDIDAEFADEFKGTIHIENIAAYPMPFYDEIGGQILRDKLIGIPEGRKYPTPIQGIRFKFLNTYQCVDYIDMKEVEDKLYFNIYVKNCGNIEIKYIDESKEKDSNIRFSGFFNKSELYKATTIDECLDSFRLISFNRDGHADTIVFFEELILTALSCVYIAFYNPNMFNEIVQLTRKHNNADSNVNRESGYRIDYIRKLPAGHKASEQAIARAKEKGYFVPEGYTYVSEVNAEEKDKIKKKTIIVKE